MGLGVNTKTGIARNNAKIVTPNHKSPHTNPRFPKKETKIEDNTIPKPTPIKCAVPRELLPKAWIDGRIKDVPKINTKALDTPAKNLIIIKRNISSQNAINIVVNNEIIIEIKKTNLIFFLKIDKIEINDPNK